MTGEPADLSIFDVFQLNKYDGDYPNDTDSSCGVFNRNGKLWDVSCNERKSTGFVCEILVW